MQTKCFETPHKKKQLSNATGIFVCKIVYIEDKKVFSMRLLFFPCLFWEAPCCHSLFFFNSVNYLYKQKKVILSLKWISKNITGYLFCCSHFLLVRGKIRLTGRLTVFVINFFSFKPSLDRVRGEITERGVPEREWEGNKGTSAGIIMQA